MTEDIYWRDGLISSRQFEDSYFSHVDGYRETQHVFIGGNKLVERWQKAETFTVAELGFGTGLNFLTTWQKFQETNPTGTLTFVSFEKYVITPQEMIQALQRWPEIKPYQDQLLALNLPTSQDTGFVTFTLPQAKLILGVGDARTLLPQWQGQADAWYLDGFAPRRNPELWEESLLRDVYTHTVEGGTAATYSAAGHVRRTLQSVGFEVQKAPGFANKRDMTVAQKVTATAGHTSHED